MPETVTTQEEFIANRAEHLIVVSGIITERIGNLAVGWVPAYNEAGGPLESVLKSHHDAVTDVFKANFQDVDRLFTEEIEPSHVKSFLNSSDQQILDTLMNWKATLSMRERAIDNVSNPVAAKVIQIALDYDVWKKIKAPKSNPARRQTLREDASNFESERLMERAEDHFTWRSINAPRSSATRRQNLRDYASDSSTLRLMEQGEDYFTWRKLMAPRISRTRAANLIDYIDDDETRVIFKKEYYGDDYEDASEERSESNGGNTRSGEGRNVPPKAEYEKTVAEIIREEIMRSPSMQKRLKLFEATDIDHVINTVLALRDSEPSITARAVYLKYRKEAEAPDSSDSIQAGVRIIDAMLDGNISKGSTLPF